MAAYVSDELVTPAMYTACVKALEGCLKCREKIAGYQSMDWPTPDHAAYLDEWQPRIEAMMAYYNQRRSINNATNSIQ